MRMLTLILVIGLSLRGYTQDRTHVFGDISEEDISYDIYPDDPDAEAVILFDIGQTRFIERGDDYDIRFERQKRIKILKKSGFSHAEISVPFFTNDSGRREYVLDIEAVTYNYENGKLIKKELDLSTVYEEVRNERWKVKKFVFPDVQVGSILEYRYALETPFHFNLPNWTFQDRIPTVYSEYQVRMIPFYEYVYFVEGVPEFDYHSTVVDSYIRKWDGTSNEITFQDHIHTCAMNDVPAYKDEQYVRSVNDNLIKMDLQLTRINSPSGMSREILSTWPKLTKSLLKNERFGRYLKECRRHASKAVESNLDLERRTEKERSIQVIEYVKDKYSWNGKKSKYASQTAKEFIRSGIGNSADINLYLVALLNAANVDAHPVIISTRDHGTINTDYPFDHFTNYVLALVKTEKAFLSDATEELLAYDRLPTRCVNGQGLLVMEGIRDAWVNMDNIAPSSTMYSSTIEVGPKSLEARVDISIQSTEYLAYYYRKTFENDTLELKSFFENKVGKINRLNTLNYDVPSRSYIIRIEGIRELESIGPHIVVDPFLGLARSANELKEETRTYPLDFIYPSNEIFEITITIPEGYVLNSIPEPFVQDDQLVQIMVYYTLSDGVLNIKGHYNFKKAIYPVDEYSKLREHIDTIVEQFNRQVVLEKEE